MKIDGKPDWLISLSGYWGRIMRVSPSQAIPEICAFGVAIGPDNPIVEITDSAGWVGTRVGLGVGVDVGDGLGVNVLDGRSVGVKVLVSVFWTVS